MTAVSAAQPEPTTTADPSGPPPSGTKKTSVASRLVALTGHWAVRLGLVVIALIWLMPTVGLLSSSLRSPEDIGVSGWWSVFDFNSSFPWVIDAGQFTGENYNALLSNELVTGSLFTTLLITIPSTLTVVIIGALAGYAFAWLDFPGRDWFFLLVVGLLVVPVQVALIPVAKLFNTLGLFETTAGVVIFHTAFGLPFAVFLLRNFFAEIPRELLEAARLDGAGEVRLFTRVVMPLGGPAIASLGIFQFLWVWNDMLVALIFADSSSPPITVALQQQVRQFGNNIDVLAPGAFVSMIIPLIVFFAFQRQFVSGMMAGAVK
ncbi:sugar ABC transporter permease [Streptomyces abyssalis]|uniref:Sugar ABC transporter permease n=1 Tax=Streptomyces abyssalis TaxID=933944 RepID=A0A1E7JJ89_9ACTN|nr:carbohydrate ABC transporter permease [Streptomyces abyssalis]OEU87164.1 sugar ABC transporter permease [Streptomyces abyssalis]OEU87698.1 sugar ABC transporter permease [Streptomyces abyssalis]OEV30021.1 sugar ABC transporter permease [Streptomyces nanshensis]